MYWLTGKYGIQTTLIVAVILTLSCSNSDDNSTESHKQSDAGSAKDSPYNIDLTTCRPVDQKVNVEADPLRLPCEPTKEECDGVDNDQDGITDPHCPSVPCTNDTDCTYGGLVADADCNDYGNNTQHLSNPEHRPKGPVCNQIDALPDDSERFECWGMLCPPGLKCVNGDCHKPGTTPPESPCTHGKDCPMNSGCIPLVLDLPDSAVCTQFCHESSCPTGYACEKSQVTGANNVVVTHYICHPESGHNNCKDDRWSHCDNAMIQCKQDPTCEQVLGCIHSSCGWDDLDPQCVTGCRNKHNLDSASPHVAALDCLTAGCDH